MHKRNRLLWEIKLGIELGSERAKQNKMHLKAQFPSK